MKSKLRVCASCEWIFQETEDVKSCPKCGFGHYGARYVYGNKAYKYQHTQEPWIQKKLSNYEIQLRNEVTSSKLDNLQATSAWAADLMTALKPGRGGCLKALYVRR